MSIFRGFSHEFAENGDGDNFTVGKFWSGSGFLGGMTLAVLIDICEYGGENSGYIKHSFVLADNSMLRL